MTAPTTHPVHESWSIRKPAVCAAGGIVASQHHLASRIGAGVLEAGGNAVDAAVTAGLAIGAVEPWMSGLGGGGFMVVYVAAERRAYAVEFGMCASHGIDPAAYPLAEGVDTDLFGWPAVVGDRNVLGPLSIAVPGLVAGHAAALERFGTRSWRDAIAPAVELAQQGMTVDWYATLKIASEAASLARFPETARVYLPGGHVPAPGWGGSAPVIRLGALGQTLARLRDAGPRDFYEGEIARRIVRDCNDAGSPLSAADLAGYAARIVGADRHRYRDALVHAAPGLSAGPTLRHALSLLAERVVPSGGTPDAGAYLAYASCLLDAWDHRLATMGDPDDSAAPGCTTHLSVADRDGNVVALTQTLLSIFGSRVVLPGTGILMNNGMMWFDPRPGRPNSIAPGKRPLSNMCPTVVERSDGLRFAAGASGGRRIMPAVFQLVSFLVDYPMTMDDAMHVPRIDASGEPLVTADPALPAGVIDALAERHEVQVAPHGVYPAFYANPNLAGCEAGGMTVGAACVTSPWARAVGAP